MYALPSRLRLNEWALSGDWTVKSEAAVLNKPNGRIAYRFHARDLHLVMGPPAPGTSVRFRVLIDGQPPGAAHGRDVDEQGNGTVDRAAAVPADPATEAHRRPTVRDRVSRSGRGGFRVHVRLIGRATIEPRRLLNGYDQDCRNINQASPLASWRRRDDRRRRSARHDRLRRRRNPPTGGKAAACTSSREHTRRSAR